MDQVNLISSNDEILSALSFENQNEVFTLTPSTPSEYARIAQKLRASIRHLEIKSIEKVNNPFTYGLYMLKKMEFKRSFPITCSETEQELFHGTPTANVLGICRNNFDYRKCGQSRGHKFGHGVSFSPNAFYASHYCERFSTTKVMFLCKIIIHKSHIGNEHTKYPSDGCDTTMKNTGDVVVKYDDDTFYPMYKITFSR